MMQPGNPAASYSVERKGMLGPFLLYYLPGLNLLQQLHKVQKSVMQSLKTTVPTGDQSYTNVSIRINKVTGGEKDSCFPAWTSSES